MPRAFVAWEQMVKLADQLQRASPLTERLAALRSYWPSWVSAAFVGYAVVECS